MNQKNDKNINARNEFKAVMRHANRHSCEDFLVIKWFIASWYLHENVYFRQAGSHLSGNNLLKQFVYQVTSHIVLHQENHEYLWLLAGNNLFSIDVANVLNVIHNFWKERVLLRSFQ